MALTEAQKYPDDFDGIIAGDAAAHGLDLAFGQLWFYQAMSKNPANRYQSAAEMRMDIVRVLSSAYPTTSPGKSCCVTIAIPDTSRRPCDSTTGKIRSRSSRGASTSASAP